jgi:ribosomal protein S12 methylthiotransferase accessory factor
MERLSSSLRTRSAADTLPRAQAMAARFGVTRVTNTTHLDLIGIPVFSSIRPDALPGSVCVCAGKGVMPVEAQVGAYMEAIELALVERRGHAGSRSATVRDLLGGNARPSALLDFCPVHGRPVSLSGALDCVPSYDLLAQREVLIPTERVAMPYRPQHGSPMYGSSTNGLASGNTVDEATLHGLLEVIERDVLSFNYVRDTAVRLSDEGLPPVVEGLVARIRAAGLPIVMRSLPNEFNVPTFDAYIIDELGSGPPISWGSGCHIVPEIALVRAVAEAVQLRGTVIHGGRDDILQLANKTNKLGPKASAELFGGRLKALMANPTTLPFDDVPSAVTSATTIEGNLDALFARLTQCGVEHVCRVVLSADTDEMQVVRVVVPTLEFFTRGVRRIGPRLLHFMLSNGA